MVYLPDVAVRGHDLKVKVGALPINNLAVARRGRFRARCPARSTACDGYKRIAVANLRISIFLD